MSFFNNAPSINGTDVKVDFGNLSSIPLPVTSHTRHGTSFFMRAVMKNPKLLEGLTIIDTEMSAGDISEKILKKFSDKK